MYDYSRAEASRVPQTEKTLKFMIIPTLGKGNDSHFPKCIIIPKNHNLLLMFLPLNRKILTGLRHQWLIHKIKLLCLADTKNYFKFMFGVLPLDFMSPNTVLIPNVSEFPNTMLKKDRRFGSKFHSCLHFSFSWRCTSPCNHKSNLKHLNKNHSASTFDFCVLINTDPSMIPSYSQCRVWEFSPILMFFFLFQSYLHPNPPTVVYFTLAWLWF